MKMMTNIGGIVLKSWDFRGGSGNLVRGFTQCRRHAIAGRGPPQKILKSRCSEMWANPDSIQSPITMNEERLLDAGRLFAPRSQFKKMVTVGAKGVRTPWIRPWTCRQEGMGVILSWCLVVPK
jgi:hypothetical protein